MNAALHLDAPAEAMTIEQICAVVAPLIGQLRVELDPPDRDGWIDKEALGNPDSGPLADLHERFSAAGFGATRRAVAASLLLRYGWAAGFSIAAWLACGAAVRITDFALKFSETTLVEAIWIRRAEIEWPRSRIGRHVALAVELHAFTRDLVERQHDWSRFSRHALWAMVASSWAAQFAAIGGRLGRAQQAVEEARAVLAVDPEIAAAAPDLYEVRVGARSDICQKRAACCLYFKGPRQHFCASCPIIPAEERLGRNREWVGTEA